MRFRQGICVDSALIFRGKSVPLLKKLEAPRLPSFFKANQPKNFSFRPRYYDADGEERERRNRLIRAEIDAENAPRPEFKSKLRERWERSNGAARNRNRSNLRLIVIVIVLLGISYLILK